MKGMEKSVQSLRGRPCSSLAPPATTLALAGSARVVPEAERVGGPVCDEERRPRNDGWLTCRGFSDGNELFNFQAGSAHQCAVDIGLTEKLSRIQGGD